MSAFSTRTRWTAAAGVLVVLLLGLLARCVYDATPAARKKHALTDLVDGLPGAVETAEETWRNLRGATVPVTWVCGRTVPNGSPDSVSCAPGAGRLPLRVERASRPWLSLTCDLEVEEPVGFSLEEPTWSQRCTLYLEALVPLDDFPGFCNGIPALDEEVGDARIEVSWSGDEEPCWPVPPTSSGLVLVRGTPARWDQFVPEFADVARVRITVEVSRTDLGGCRDHSSIDCDPLIDAPRMPPVRELRELAR